MTLGADKLQSKTITDDHLPGYAELYERLRQEGKKPDDMAQALESKAASHVLPVQATRGIATPFKAMVDFLRGRKHVEDLGVHVLEVPWLEFHIPRNSSGQLKWKTSQSDELAFNLNVFGSGLGSGRSISWSVESDIPARSICLKFIQQLNVRVQLYLVTESARPGAAQSANVGISFKREARLSCTLVYEFAKGRCYQPYWPIGRSTDLPYWSSTV